MNPIWVWKCPSCGASHEMDVPPWDFPSKAMCTGCKAVIATKGVVVKGKPVVPAHQSNGR